MDTKLFDYPMMGGNFGGEEEGEMFREEPTQKPSPAAQSPGEDNSDLLTYVFIAYNTHDQIRRKQAYFCNSFDYQPKL